ncbi:hypothetical protein BJ138DRAFT_1120865 [Hygrophoropsis aurantiaca]|uniref:Uncharacterized protein n=1 Tax=Hygrophoropsis aurantiaca TaxID=72124 RepID=A0ACB7ZQE1_9AGAM|nr:hypothetical protein BJ138DRAFT_1120865 [Hygrophoropsis aurantiaca]
MLWSSSAKALEPRQRELRIDVISQFNRPFIRPYNGAAVDGFIEYLKTNNRKFSQGNYYGKFCAIIQSSGTGKSRLIVELRHRKVIVIYMDLRSVNDNGFPERDDIPATILTEEFGFDKDVYFARCCHFLEALFKAIQTEFQSVPRDAKPESVGDFIRNWNEGMCSMGSRSRATFFDRVRAAYNQIPSTAASSVVAAYENMLNALQHIIKSNTDEPQLVIAFDEAHTLNQGRNDFSPMHMLCRAISEYSRFCQPQSESVWVVFVSTTFDIANFSVPPATIQNSARFVVAGELLFPPYVQLGWDQGAAALGDVATKDVSRVDHIIRFGRPLWTSINDMDPQGMSGVIAVAGMKLCKSSRFEANDQNLALAALSQRFCLDVSVGHPEAVRYLETAVASHLRVCLAVTEDRTWKSTSYPSEPFLSCVAAGLIHRSEGTLRDTLGALVTKVEGGLFEIGQNGELASRLLWLLAKDIYVRKVLHANIRGIRCIGQQDFIDCVRVPEIAFLEYVLGDPFTKALHQQTRGGLDSSGQLWTESQSPQKGFYISSSIQTGLRLSTSVQIGYRLSQHHRDITKHYILLTIVLED